MANTPIAAINTDRGAATPPPLPDALITPTTSGITKADENTGPMKPTDCAITSGRERTFAPSRSYEEPLICRLQPVASCGDRMEANDHLSIARDLVYDLAAERSDRGAVVDELRRLDADRAEPALQLVRDRGQRPVQVGRAGCVREDAAGPAHVLDPARPEAGFSQQFQLLGGRRAQRVIAARVALHPREQPRGHGRTAKPQQRPSWPRRLGF